MTIPPSRARAGRGFSLVELLIAVVLSTILVVALMGVAQNFSSHAEFVRTAVDTGSEEALVTLTDAVRRGWVVESPSSRELRVTDVLGNQTRYYLDGTSLKVSQARGAVGTLMDNVTDLSVQVSTMARLRDEAPVTAQRIWWTRPEPAGTPGLIVVEDGVPAALGFEMPAAVPDDFDTVSSVNEQALHGTLDRILLAVAQVPGVSPDPSESEEDDGGTSKGKGKDKPNKTTICHVPPGNPGNAHTISVGNPAVLAHLAHGDYLGPCGGSGSSGSGSSPPPPAGTLVVELYEARAPDDARPYGAPLAGLSMPLSALPLGQQVWTEIVEESSSGSGSSGSSGSGSSGNKTTICHVPPGNPGNAHTISVGNPAVPAHLAHGDYLGPCSGETSSSSTWVSQFDVPTTEIPIDLAPLGALIEPERAYTLVFKVSGAGYVLLRAFDSSSANHSGVAMQNGSSFEPQALTIPFSLDGMQNITQTSEHQVVSMVGISLETDEVKQASSVVAGQIAAPNPWYGAVAGELPSLRASP